MIAAHTGMPVETVAVVRWRARHAWAPPTVAAYMDDPRSIERADPPYTEVRL